MAILGTMRRDLTSRAIREEDRQQVVDCLFRGFPYRGRKYWQLALDRMALRPAVRDCPKYGYALEASGRIVGVVLQLFSLYRVGGVETIRCNLSSWCVDSDYRSSAVRMVAAAMNRKDVTYTTISPVPRTRRAAEAIGFRRYSNGQIVFAPAFTPSQRDGAVVEYSDGLPEAALLSQDERQLLGEHARLGCRSLICVKNDDAVPLVFVERWILKDLVPYWQLVYCRSIDDLARWAGSVGRFLLQEGVMFCVADSNGPIPGLIGYYRSDWAPRYFKGPLAPSLGDLSFTELVVFGP
jgi:hypothetical protein